MDNSEMIYKVVHSKYLVVIKTDKLPTRDAEGKVVFEKDTKIGLVTIPDATMPGEQGKQVLPVFTDKAELEKWPGMFKDGNVPQTLFMPFNEIVNVINGSVMTGMVINPFTAGSALYMGREMLDNIQKLPAYQQEFLGAQGGTSHVNIPKDTKVKLSIPEESAELRKIKGTISDYGCAHEFINEIYLLVMESEVTPKGYYCLVDCEKEQLKTVAEELSVQVRPFLNDIKVISFAAGDQISKLNDKIKMDTLVHRRV